MTERPYTPVTLAKRWSCTAAHVRNLVRRGEIEGFTLGGKLLRISAAEVERYECRTIDSGATEESSASSGTTSKDADNVARLVRQTRPKPKPSR